jgi:glyoxylate/hydroxypyruvate reductase
LASHPKGRGLCVNRPYKADPRRGRQWAEIFGREAPDIEFRLWPEVGDDADVRYLAAWEPPADLATRFPNLQLLVSTGAVVDQQT